MQFCYPSSFSENISPPPHHCEMHGGGFLCDRNKEVGREITAPPHYEYFD